MSGAKPRRGRWVLLILVLVALALAFLSNRAAPPVEVETLKVSRGEVKEIVPSSAAGEVKPIRRVTVRAEIAGTVAQVLKKRGDRIEDKERVLVFRSDELEARQRQAKANLEAATVAKTMASSRTDAAGRAHDRAKKLHAGGAITDVEMDRAETELLAAQQAVLQAEATKEQSKAALELANVARDHAILNAPFAGVLQDVFADVGVQLAPGAPLFDLIDDSTIHLDVPVDEADVGKISVGQPVILRGADPQHSEDQLGQVRFIPPAVGRSGSGLAGVETEALAKRDRSIYVEIVPQHPERLRIGASVNAEFLVRKKDQVLFVPTHVVIGRGVEREVYLVREGRAKKVSFQPGLTSWERTEIQSGLVEGDEVIASLNAKDLADGAKVKLRLSLEQKERPPTEGLVPQADGRR